MIKECDLKGQTTLFSSYADSDGSMFRECVVE